MGFLVEWEPGATIFAEDTFICMCLIRLNKTLHPHIESAGSCSPWLRALQRAPGRGRLVSLALARAPPVFLPAKVENHCIHVQNIYRPLSILKTFA